MLFVLSLSIARMKMIGWIGIVFVSWVFIYKNYSMFKLRHILFTLLVVLLICQNQLYKYFVVYADQARGAIIRNFISNF